MNLITNEKAQQIINALNRYKEIGGSVVVNPRNEAELEGLRRFAAQAMLEHGAELMGNWVALRTEYEPLVQVLARIAQRITAMNNRPAEAPTNDAAAAIENAK